MLAGAERLRPDRLFSSELRNDLLYWRRPTLNSIYPKRSSSRATALIRTSPRNFCRPRLLAKILEKDMIKLLKRMEISPDLQGRPGRSEVPQLFRVPTPTRRSFGSTTCIILNVTLLKVAVPPTTGVQEQPGQDQAVSGSGSGFIFEKAAANELREQGSGDKGEQAYWSTRIRRHRARATASSGTSSAKQFS